MGRGRSTNVARERRNGGRLSTRDVVNRPTLPVEQVTVVDCLHGTWSIDQRCPRASQRWSIVYTGCGQSTNVARERRNGGRLSTWDVVDRPTLPASVATVVDCLHRMWSIDQ